MKTKQIPLIVMLLAGAVTSICARLMRYELETTLWILLLVLIVFYIVGCFIKKTIESFERAAAAREAEERAKAEAEAAEAEAAAKAAEAMEADGNGSAEGNTQA